MSDSDEVFIEAAIEQSRLAARGGEYPYGAVLVCEDTILLRCYNTSQSTKDLTAHAELSLIRQATRQFSADQLARCALFSSCEPCAMCAGALYWSGIGRLVYACSTELDAKISDMPFAIPCRSIVQVNGGHTVDVRGPLLEESAALVLRAYWSKQVGDSSASFGLAK